jgi:hypothetical protein
MSGECRHVVSCAGECADCGAVVPPALDAERWKVKAGKCAGCGREVKNGWSRGKGVACTACLFAAWGAPAESKT